VRNDDVVSRRSAVLIRSNFATLDLPACHRSLATMFGRVPACVAVDFFSEFGCDLEVPLMDPSTT
jgi:hypothetical protein